MATEQERFLMYQKAVDACEKVAEGLVGKDNGFVCMFVPNKHAPIEQIPFLISNAPDNDSIIWLISRLLEALKNGRAYDPRNAIRES